MSTRRVGREECRETSGNEGSCRVFLKISSSLYRTLVSRAGCLERLINEGTNTLSLELALVMSRYRGRIDIEIVTSAGKDHMTGLECCRRFPELPFRGRGAQLWDGKEQQVDSQVGGYSTKRELCQGIRGSLGAQGEAARLWHTERRKI